MVQTSMLILSVCWRVLVFLSGGARVYGRSEGRLPPPVAMFLGHSGETQRGYDSSHTPSSPQGPADLNAVILKKIASA